jgi:nucleotide-binding universal stress UspA family protein
MSSQPLLSGIERTLVAQREYERGRADANAEFLARTLQCEREQLRKSVFQCGRALRILVAIDGSDHPAIKAAVELAEVVGGTIGLIYVVDASLRERVLAARHDSESPSKALRDQAIEMLEACRSTIPPEVASEWILREGNPADEILSAAAEWGPDILIIGTRNRAPLTQFFLGSTSAAVVRDAVCPVLLIHESAALAAQRPALPKLSPPPSPPTSKHHCHGIYQRHLI